MQTLVASTVAVALLLVTSGRGPPARGLDRPRLGSPRPSGGAGNRRRGMVQNRLLRTQGVVHRRLFLYRPGVALVIVDDLDSPLVHSYIRYLQLHPDVTLGDRDQRSIQIEAPGFAGAIYDAAGEARALRTQARGQKDPFKAGAHPISASSSPAGRSPSQTRARARPGR